MDIKEKLVEDGYVVIPDVLTSDEVSSAYKMFMDWKKTIKNHDEMHRTINPHNIYKYHEVGHQKHAWFIRTRPAVINIFKKLWDTDEVVVSFDGCCYIDKNEKRKDKFWCHSDQSPCKDGLRCYQGLVSLTSNKEKTFVIWEGTHKEHQNIFKDKSKISDWQKVPPEMEEPLSHRRKVITVEAGSMILWDSRLLHQNQYGNNSDEERLVQYVCMLPKNHKDNNESENGKREFYFRKRRTTSHWPYKIHVNPKQPRTFGNDNLLINYDELIEPELDEYMETILTLL